MAGHTWHLVTPHCQLAAGVSFLPQGLPLTLYIPTGVVGHPRHPSATICFTTPTLCLGCLLSTPSALFWC